MNRFKWLNLKRPGPGFSWIRQTMRKLRDERGGRKARVAAWVVLSALAAAPVRAQHLIAWPIGRPPPILVPPVPGPRPMPLPLPMPRPDVNPLPLGGQKLEGLVKSQVATLWLDITFRNDTGGRLEGELFMPLPADAVIDKLEMRLGDRILKAELLDADRARTAYENIVRQMRDPALLELQSERLVRCRVFPIEPHSAVTLRFNYTQILPKAGGLYSLKVPLARVHGGDAKQSIKVEFETETPIRLLYSPTHSADIKKEGSKKAEVRFDGSSRGASELVVLYSLDEGELATSILSNREAGEDGTFMLSLAPRVSSDGKPTPKDVVFVFDRSGSMEEESRMEQARKALQYMLSRLQPGDRFGIVDFATGANSMSENLLAAAPETKARAKKYVDRLEASGGTNISEALDQGLKLLSGPRPSGRMPMLVFMTDGLPTVGETDTDSLLRRIHSANKSIEARFFCLGAGADVNSLFLDKLAEGQRGGRDYVLPGEDIEVKVGQLYDRISKPAITDVELEWEGVEARQVYPKEITDIYYGDPVVLLGRYSKHGKGKLVLTGKASGKDVRFEFPFGLPRESDKHAYLPRLWAHRKVAHLLDEIRLSGSKNPEITAEIAKLAKRYGIVTPYTSLFVAEDKDMAAVREEAATSFNRMRADAATAGSPAARRGHIVSRMLGAAKSAAAGPMEFSMMSAAGSLSGGEGAGGSAFDAKELEAEKKARDEMKEVGSKTFYRRGEAWVDGAFEADDAKPSVEEIEFLSDRYFELLRKHPEARPWLALGKNVTFSLGGKAYRIVEKK